MTHDIKIWPGYYHAVRSGEKTFEVRNNDRNYQKGDLVLMRYFDPEYFSKNPDASEADTRAKWDETWEPLAFKIGFVFVLDAQRVVFSLLNAPGT